ncbi:MAG: HAD family hydrolase [Eubacteriales bacterium]|nr:HAD family hydrolase [Eubacteriales bacterium]
MKAILFDIDDTLYNQIQPFENAYRDVFGQQQSSWIEALFKQSRKRSDEVFEASRRGEITMEEMYIYRVQKALADFDIQVTDKQALDFQERYVYYGKCIALTETMKKILDFCRKYAKLGIITNGPAARQWGKTQTLGLLNWVKRENIFVSGDLGVAKPDQRIFEYAARQMGLDDDRIYVGDSYANDVIGAVHAGWDAVWFNRRNREIPAGQRVPAYCIHTEQELYDIIRELI